MLMLKTDVNNKLVRFAPRVGVKIGGALFRFLSRDSLHIVSPPFNLQGI